MRGGKVQSFSIIFKFKRALQRDLKNTNHSF